VAPPVHSLSLLCCDNAAPQLLRAAPWRNLTTTMPELFRLCLWAVVCCHPTCGDSESQPTAGLHLASHMHTSRSARCHLLHKKASCATSVPLQSSGLSDSHCPVMHGILSVPIVLHADTVCTASCLQAPIWHTARLAYASSTQVVVSWCCCTHYS
jgi:hypothetical protein